MKHSRAFIVWFWILSAPFGSAWIEGGAMPSSPAGGLALTGVVHLQDIGDVPLRDGVWAGTKGQSRRLEGFSVNFAVPVAGVGIAYMCPPARRRGHTMDAWRVFLRDSRPVATS